MSGLTGGPTGDHLTSMETAIADAEHQAGPTERVGAVFMARYAFAYFGMWVALLTPIVVTLALRAKQIAPDGTANALSLVLGVGSLLALLGNPFFGKLSDRTRSRFGRRRPWLVGGVITGTIGLLTIALAPSVPVLVVGWAITQLSFNAVLGAITAVLPDQFPEEQRGRMSGILGLCVPVGIITGTFIAKSLSENTLLMFMVPAAVGVVAILQFVAALRNDHPLDPNQPLPPYRIGEFLRSFWVNPRTYPDYGWAWFSRLFLNWGYATALSYQVLFLTNHLGVEQTAVAGLVFISSTTLQATAVIFSGLGGWLSDRLGRRKIVVVIAAILLASGLSVAAFADSFTMFLVGVGIAGIGQGLYIAVELAVVSDVITSPRNAARDFGVSNIANTLPQTLVPTLAPLILAIPLFGNTGGNNYTALFLFGGVLTLLGAAAILPAKKLR